jgi:hypothetical protein
MTPVTLNGPVADFAEMQLLTLMIRFGELRNLLCLLSMQASAFPL